MSGSRPCGHSLSVLAAANDLEKSGGGRGHIHALTAASAMYAADTMGRVLSEAVQIHGGSGYIWESEINRLFRATKLLEIAQVRLKFRQLIISGELFAPHDPVRGGNRPNTTDESFALEDEALATFPSSLAANLLADRVVVVSAW